MTATTAKTPLPETARPLRADARRNRERVLEAARRVFARDGLDAQIEEIARRAKVGVGTVYRHFPNKEDLLAALAEKRFEWLAGRAREALAGREPVEAFRDFMRDSAELQAKDLALSEAMGSRPEMMRAAAEGAGMRELMDELVSRAQVPGGLRRDISGNDVPMIICGLGSVTRASETNPFMRWDRLLEIVLDGLMAPGTTRLP